MRALHIAPFSPIVRLHRGRALLANGNARAALKQADTAQKLSGKPYAEASVLKARALIKLGKKGAARKLLTALKQTPEIKKLLESL